MLLGYNTNGFAHHRLTDAIAILAELGYQSIAITVDLHSLNPFADDPYQQILKVQRLLKRHKLRSVIETGARFLLDPKRKHQPTLISPTAEERQRRLDFLVRCIDLAAELGSDAVSFWSGKASDDASPKVLMQRLTEGVEKLCDHADVKKVRLTFEPEPGMFIDTMVRYAELRRKIDHPRFGLTIDVGHLHCQGETPIPDVLEKWQDRLWNIHIEDMRQGVHDHLMFGEGEMDFPPILGALREINYAGGVHVELSRHSHDAVETARRAIEFLAPLAGP